MPAGVSTCTGRVTRRAPPRPLLVPELLSRCAAPAHRPCSAAGPRRGRRSAAAARKSVRLTLAPRRNNASLAPLGARRRGWTRLRARVRDLLESARGSARRDQPPLRPQRGDVCRRGRRRMRVHCTAGARRTKAAASYRAARMSVSCVGRDLRGQSEGRGGRAGIGQGPFRPSRFVVERRALWFMLSRALRPCRRCQPYVPTLHALRHACDHRWHTQLFWQHRHAASNVCPFGHTHADSSVPPKLLRRRWLACGSQCFCWCCA